LDGGRELVHGTAIAMGGHAALIRGPSGSGKSDLALRCLAFSGSTLIPGPVELVADDWVVLMRQGNEIVAAAPDSIRGMLEVRGIGIVTVPVVEAAKLVLVVDLVAAENYERLPDPGRRVTLLNLALAIVEIAPFEGSAALKLLLALQRANYSGTQP
jgi:serine kinase of HPr protein (carbohydrate metabolism regulator)